jgi:hypothetical protein
MTPIFLTSRGWARAAVTALLLAIAEGASGGASGGGGAGTGYQIDATCKWLMRSLDDERRPSASADTGVTLRLVGTLDIEHVDEGVRAVTPRWTRIEYAEKTAQLQRQWVVEDFADRAALRERLLQATTRYRPLLNFPQAGAHEAETVALLLAQLSGRAVRMDPAAGPWEFDAQRETFRRTLRQLAPAWPDGSPFALYVGSVVSRDGRREFPAPPFVFLPFAERMEAVAFNQLKAWALAVAEPERARLRPRIFEARPEVMVALGESRLSETMRKRLLNHPSPTPIGSVVSLMGWLPVDGAVVRDVNPVNPELLDPDTVVTVRRPNVSVVVQAEEGEPLRPWALAFVRSRSDLKVVSSKQDDVQRLSDARRGKRPGPATGPARVVWAQRLREAEARRWLLDNAEAPVWLDYTPADQARLNFGGLWLIEDHAVSHDRRRVDPEAPRDSEAGQRALEVPAERAGWQGLGVRTLVPSCVAVRFNATAGVPWDVPPYMERSPRARIRLEAETQLWWQRGGASGADGEEGIGERL